jgi:hypothetical protein
MEGDDSLAIRCLEGEMHPRHGSVGLIDEQFVRIEKPLAVDENVR